MAIINHNGSLADIDSNRLMQQFLARYRIGISRLFFAVVALLLLLTTWRWPDESRLPLLMVLSGFVLVCVAVLGRLWCSLYISGYKNQRVVQAGPYSMVRNPLYFFSLLGGIGLALASGSLVILVLMLVFFVGVYPLTIANEEDKLESLFGDEYREYRARTPRLLPKPSLYQRVEQYTINVNAMERAFLDAVWFLLIFAAIVTLQIAQQQGWVPVMGRLA